MSGRAMRISGAINLLSAFLSSNIFFGRWSAVSRGAFGGAAGEEEADGYQQDLADDPEEKAAGHRLEDAGQEANGGVEPEDAE